MVLDVSHGLGHVLAKTLHAVPISRLCFSVHGLIFIRGVVACFDLRRFACV